MPVDTRIGFLGGGNMAEAILRGLLAKKHVRPQDIFVSEPRAERRSQLASEHGIQLQEDNRQVAEQVSVLILAVKPAVAQDVLREVSDCVSDETLIISVAAGVTTATMESALGAGARVVRAMPNTPALVGSGATALCAGTHATASDLDVARSIFEAVGITAVVKEQQLDAITGLSGSGPAYAFLFLEAMADAGVKMGLPRDIALQFAAHTLLGSAKLLIETNGHPGQLKDMVTSPGGTTIAGVHALEAGGFRTTLINAVEAATNRSKELGKES